MTGFWGNPTYRPRDKDVARFLEQIRKLTADMTQQRSLGIASSALHAIASFIAVEHGLRELYALLDRIKAEVTE
jgi:hypothetical protein